MRNCLNLVSPNVFTKSLIQNSVMEYRAEHSVNIFLAYRTKALGKVSGYTVINCVHNEYQARRQGLL
jgi:hypothetical protein